MDIPKILETMTNIDKYLLLSVVYIDCNASDTIIRIKEAYASFTDASCMFRSLGTIIYPIPIISSARKPSICSILWSSDIPWSHLGKAALSNITIIQIDPTEDPRKRRITAAIMNGLLTAMELVIFAKHWSFCEFLSWANFIFTTIKYGWLIFWIS